MRTFIRTEEETFSLLDLQQLPRDEPVDVAVDVGLPVTHVDHHVPGEAGLTSGGMGHAPSTLVIDVTRLGVRVVTLHSRTREVRGLRRGLRHVEFRVPVLAGDGKKILQGRR